MDPPLPNLPSFGRKWMCPNHVDQLLVRLPLSSCILKVTIRAQHPKRRIPKQNTQLLEITKLNERNNGNIDIIHPQAASTSENKVVADEVSINGRRYRVPERVIILDFWGKVGKVQSQGARFVTRVAINVLWNYPSASEENLKLHLQCHRPLPL